VKFLSEYRDQRASEQLAQAIWKKVTRPWTVMEICGGQTHTIVKSGIEDLLPRDITLVHGPGCPVCVTPIALIDKAVAIAHRPDVIFCSFGDMLRVPGSTKSLFDAKAEGADVRIVYSPLDALKLAKQNPDRQVVFFAVGFETTAPGRPITITSKIFRCLFPTCSSLRRWRLSSRRTSASSRDSSPRVTSAPSWATKNIFR
jgi:hydrogenase expression/formation protein HypD